MATVRVFDWQSVLGRVVAGIAVCLITGTLTACGTIPQQAIGEAPLILPKASDPRIDLRDTGRLESLATAVEARLQVTGKPLALLAISGGGAKGAYGAGVLAGWSETGTRPEFDVVTGVSTGALSAPFAFLGKNWDDRLKLAYVDGKAENILGWKGMAILTRPSFFNGAVLRSLVEEHVTPDVLSEIAIEHAKGRRLLVVTTDLGGERAVLWDMGLLASRGDRQSLELFRKVLVASASIPLVFPPVVVAGKTDDGVPFREVHVDGGVAAPFLAFPVHFLSDDFETDDRHGHIYLIINGHIEPHNGAPPRFIGGILAGTYNTLTKSTLRAHMAANKAFARRYGLEFQYVSIPEDIKASPLDFAPETMTSLFDAGREAALSGRAWEMTTDRQTLSPDKNRAGDAHEKSYE